MVRNEHSLALLDFPRMRGRLAGYCLSQEGREVMEASFPVGDRDLLESFKKDLKALLDWMEGAELPALSFPDIGAVVKRLAVEGLTLELDELHALSLWTRDFDTLAGALRKVKFPSRSSPEAFIPDAAFEPDTLAGNWASPDASSLMEALPSLHAVHGTIGEILAPDGELRDLPELKRIRDSISRANRDLLSIADSYRNNPELKSALQSEEPTQRDGRTVLAVRANFRGRVRGIVHEVSATGQTLFIEPEALVDKNNELVQLEAKLRAEIFRILKETTERLRPMAPAVARSRTFLALLDLRLARALQARREELILPETLPAGLTLWRARHPLLGKKAVPIDVDLPDEVRTLVVTGPNTGGKTVTLKTIGLFALLHQFGAGLPAAQGTKLQVFDAVLADIGDEQSIDQSLSTFSGHMKVMSEVTRLATGRSLVLLDELGAGTDPEEGCAIAMGLLDWFIARGSLVMATTHHGILKNYGYTRPGCLNASMEFDSSRLAPTYRIVMGIPGESRALEIASQVGLDREIVRMAGSYLAEERSDVGVLIRGLNEKRRELDILEREQRRKLKSATEEQRKADLASLRVRQREAELRRHGLSELGNLLRESRKTLENLVRELRESGVSTDRTKDVKQFLADLATSVEKQYSLMEAEEQALREEEAGLERPMGNEAGDGVRREGRTKGQHRGAQRALQTGSVSGESIAGERAIEPGMDVVMRPSGRKGKVLRKAQGDTWLVETGSLRLTVAGKDLIPAKEDGRILPAYDLELAPADTGAQFKAVFELDVRGFRLQEALDAVERQVDAAGLQGLQLFSIIHGTGEGILGRGIHEWLKRSPVIDDYHFARPEEGGYGKTIVRLKG